MIYFWIAIGLIDAFIILFFYLLCLVSLRRKPNDLCTRKYPEGHPMIRVQKVVREGRKFFREHPAELLVIDANGVELCAKRYVPENPKGRILMMHGYRSIAENDFSVGAEFYYHLGYELILVDQRAHGKSTGAWIGFGVLERYDCLSWLRFLNHTYGELPTFLSGISMGATTVLMACGLDLPKNVKGVIADCGFTSPKEIIAHVMKRKMHLPTLMLPPISFFSKLIVGYSFGACSTVDAMKTNRIPILFIHGKNDHFVPPEMTVQNYEACTAEKQLLLVDGAGHGTSFLQDRPMAEKTIAAFLERYRQ